MIKFIRSLFKEKCNHEVDMSFMEYPKCINCSEKLPLILTTHYGWKVDPALREWHLRASLDKLMKPFNQSKKKPKTCGFCSEPCGNDWCCMKDEK